MNGILLVKKPAGISSFGVVATACKKLGIRKIGHAGTLDPFADGLLVLAIGSATRALSDFLLSEKTYSATVLLGATSATLDPESEIVFSEMPPVISRIEMENILKTHFSGKITQIPPIFSALKIDGKRAYALARQGKAVEMPTRETEVFSAEIVDFSSDAKYQNLPTAQVILRVKSGFYVRSFARDFAEQCGAPGLCTTLSRLSVGDFELKDAICMEDITPEKILPITPEMFSLPAILVNEDQQIDFFHGKSLVFDSPHQGRVAVFSETQEWIGFAEISDGLLFPKKVVFEK